MAELERTSLYLDGNTLTGITKADGATSAAKVFSRLFSRPEASAEPSEEEAKGHYSNEPQVEKEDEKTSTEDTPPSLAEAMAEAIRELKIEEGCVLALPADYFVTRILSLPATDPESLSAMVRLQMEKIAPVSGDELTVASEVIAATEDTTRIFAVAAPIAELDLLAEDLYHAGLKVSRLDSTLLCEWRSFSKLAPPPAPPDAPYAVLFAPPSGRLDLIVADAAGPLFARALGTDLEENELTREFMLSLLDAGVTPVRIFAVESEGRASRLPEAAFAPAHAEFVRIPANELVPYETSAVERDAEEGHLDIIPEAWRNVERESASRKRMIAGALAAVALWLLLAAVLFLAPVYVKHRTTAVKKAIAQITPAYQSVSDVRSRVRLIRSYEDRSQSSIEILRLICGVMPEGVTLSSLQYEKTSEQPSRDKEAGGVKIVGEATQSASVLQFKDALDQVGLFAPSKLTGPTMDGKRQNYRFEIDARFLEGGN